MASQDSLSPYLIQKPSLSSSDPTKKEGKKERRKGEREGSAAKMAELTSSYGHTKITTTYRETIQRNYLQWPED